MKTLDTFELQPQLDHAQSFYKKNELDKLTSVIEESCTVSELNMLIANLLLKMQIGVIKLYGEHVRLLLITNLTCHHVIMLL